MVGISGVIGQSDEELGGSVEALRHTGEESISETAGPGYRVAVVSHPAFADDQPVDLADGEQKLWLWGELFGHDDGGYVAKADSHSDHSASQYCAHLYGEYGLDFLERVNGEFVGLIYDGTTEEAVFFTDRLGTRPLYYTRRDDASIVFSSSIQALPKFDGVTGSFDRDYLQEFVAMGRVYGLQTPLVGVHQLPPSAAVRYSHETGELDASSYWYPEYDPVDKPASYFVSELVSRLRDAIDDRTCEGSESALLLSGGSDSRLLLAAAANDLDGTYHMNDWRCDEAQVAERLAMEMDVDFTFLRREEDYAESVMDVSPNMSEFIGRFTDAHAAGFGDLLRDETDFVFHGTFSDPLFKNEQLPQRLVNLGRFGFLQLPFLEEIDSLWDFVTLRGMRRGGSLIETSTPEYYRAEKDIRRVLAENMHRLDDGSIESHGVWYDSIESLVQSHEYYPLTNYESYFFYGAALQSHPTRTPFLDNRLVDLHLELPRQYQLRRNLVADAVGELAPELAALPYAGSGNSGIAMRWPFYAHYAVEKGTDLVSNVLRQVLPSDPEISTSRLTQGSWMDYDGLIRENDFIARTLDDHSEQIQALDVIDEQAVADCYRYHMRGAPMSTELLTLATLLNVPIVDDGDVVGTELEGTDD